MSSTFAAEVSRRLALAAAPTFAVMAVLAAADGGPGAMFCGAPLHGSSQWSLSGMATMYALMSVFHAGPWLTRLGRRAVDYRGDE